MADLLSCPFCGGEAKELQCPGGSWVRCTACKASSDDSRAVEKWNRRAAPEPPAPAGEVLTFSYRNWRGEVAVRRVQPLGIHYGSTEWHPEPQWLLHAVDLDKGEEREFAMRDIGAAPAGEVVAWRDGLHAGIKAAAEAANGIEPELLAGMSERYVSIYCTARRDASDVILAIPDAPCEYCGDGKMTGLPSNVCENCMGTGLKYPELSK